ncbi:MAG TPA: BamA/TamA family outer membrane protein [Gemmatimonadales bacterium]|nr:BamA/TamA family outer membrane protein [Gemmatimonadales bacterium]
MRTLRLSAPRRALNRSRRAALVALAMVVAAVVPASLRAQGGWLTNLYPYAYYSGIDGWWGGGHYAVTSPVAAPDRPEPYAADLSLDASGSTAGSYHFVVGARAPAYWPGWRAAMTLTAARDNRLGFYGLGNDTPFSSDSATATAPYFYRVARTYASVRAIVARRMTGPVRVFVSATVERTTFRPLAGPSVFASDLARGAEGATGAPFTDRAMQGGIAFDTRDDEVDPHRGVLVEGAFGGGTGYTRTTAFARAYAHPTARCVVAARVEGQDLGGSPPLASEVTIDEGEQEFLTLGGYQSLRGYDDARFLGTGALLGGLEVRYAVVRAPSVLELKIVAFYDAGRVFGPGEGWRLTTAELHHAAGGELALRFLRRTLVIAGVGAGADGALFLFGTQWSF